MTETPGDGFMACVSMVSDLVAPCPLSHQSSGSHGRSPAPEGQVARRSTRGSREQEATLAGPPSQAWPGTDGSLLRESLGRWEGGDLGFLRCGGPHPPPSTPTAGNQGPWPSPPPWAVTVPRALVSSSPSHEPCLGLVTAPSAWAAAGGSSLDPLPPLLATKGTWATGTGRPAPPPWLLWDTAFKTWAPLRAQTQERHRSKLLAAFRAGDTGVCVGGGR